MKRDLEGYRRLLRALQEPIGYRIESTILPPAMPGAAVRLSARVDAVHRATVGTADRETTVAAELAAFSGAGLGSVIAVIHIMGGEDYLFALYRHDGSRWVHLFEEIG